MIRSGSISIPTALAPNSSAAMMIMRPSPDPRSRTVSSGVTLASCNIFRAVSRGVGVHGAPLTMTGQSSEKPKIMVQIQMTRIEIRISSQISNRRTPPARSSSILLSRNALLQSFYNDCWLL